jgi:hypothetical protein
MNYAIGRAALHAQRTLQLPEWKCQVVRQLGALSYSAHYRPLPRPPQLS